MLGGGVWSRVGTADQDDSEQDSSPNSEKYARVKMLATWFSK